MIRKNLGVHTAYFEARFIVCDENKRIEVTICGQAAQTRRRAKEIKIEYSAEKNLAKQMEAAVLLYKDNMTLQAIADGLSLNPIKVRKLLITAGVYESDTAKLVQQTFNNFRNTQNYKIAVTSTMSALQLSRPSVTSYLRMRKACTSRRMPMRRTSAPALNVSVITERSQR